MKVYQIKKDKFKSIYFSINFTMQANAKEISENTVLTSILSKSSQKWRTQLEIEQYLCSLYGSNFDINVEKLGDLYNVEFRIECIHKKYLPEEKDVLPDCLAFLEQIIFHPYLEQSKFEESLVISEKNNILNRILQRKDDKIRYAITRTEELLTPNEPFSIYIYGDETIVPHITAGDLYKRYLGLLNNSCITVVASGNLTGYENIEALVKQIFEDKLESKIKMNTMITDVRTEKKPIQEIEQIKETQDTTQTVITMGLRLPNPSRNDFFAFQMYNAILGGTSTSKLFQNFRERESLAYDVRSRYYRYKNIVVIYAGIQKEKIERAKQVLMQEISDMDAGNITQIEFNAAKENLVSDLLEWDDSKIALEKMLIANLFFYHDDNMTLENMIEGIKNVTIEDVVAIANRLQLELVYVLGGDENA